MQEGALKLCSSHPKSEVWRTIQISAKRARDSFESIFRLGIKYKNDIHGCSSIENTMSHTSTEVSLSSEPHRCAVIGKCSPTMVR